MTPVQYELLSRVMWLMAAAMFGGVVSAFVFRKLFSCGFIIVSFVISVIMIFLMSAVAQTNNPTLIYACMTLFGASVAADVGGFALIVGQHYELDEQSILEGVSITFICCVVTTFVAGLIGLYSGINFQGLGYWLFAGLFVLIGLGVAGIAGWISSRAEWFIGIAASVFWAVYMIYDFNRIVVVYTENTWPAAVSTAMQLYLDFVNLFIRLLPYILAAMSKK